MKDKKMEVIDYINRIDQLKKMYGLTAKEIYTLQMAAIFKYHNLDYYELETMICQEKRVKDKLIRQYPYSNQPNKLMF